VFAGFDTERCYRLAMTALRTAARVSRKPLLFAALVLWLAACTTHESVDGGGSSGGGGGGHIKIDWPF
jgi:hypothetical protein